jgi:chlorobactene glucosyltransferase
MGGGPQSILPSDLAFSVFLTLLHGCILAALTLAVVQLALNLASVPRLRKVGKQDGDLPRVSVLVPARNEALNIEACVRSLLSQEYPNFSVHVLNDHSTDETAEIVRSTGLNEGNGGLLQGAALPAGWVGKNWACHQLSQVADGDYLLFTDADTVHAPGALRAMVTLALERRATLLSAWPRQRMVSMGECLVVSLLPFVGALAYPHFFLRLLETYPWLRGWVPAGWRRRLGAANGQVILFERGGYERVGGHAALRSHLVEDIALGRAVAARMGEGLWWVNCDGAGLVECRMYRDFGEVWEGFTKNVRAAFEGEILQFCMAGFGQALVFLLPFLALFGPETQRIWARWEVAMVLLLRILATLGLGGSWWSVALHPVAYTLALAIGLNSWRRSAGSGVRWKGRLYAVSHPAD